MVKHYLHKHSAPSAFRRVLLAAMLLLIGATASAYDFSAENEDGVTIHYNKLDDGGVEATKGNENNKRNVTIPPSATYEGTSYSVSSIGAYAFCLSIKANDSDTSAEAIKVGANAIKAVNVHSTKSTATKEALSPSNAEFALQADIATS